MARVIINESTIEPPTTPPAMEPTLRCGFASGEGAAVVVGDRLEEEVTEREVIFPTDNPPSSKSIAELSLL